MASIGSSPRDDSSFNRRYSTRDVLTIYNTTESEWSISGSCGVLIKIEKKFNEGNLSTENDLSSLMLD